MLRSPDHAVYCSTFLNSHYFGLVSCYVSCQLTAKALNNYLHRYPWPRSIPYTEPPSLLHTHGKLGTTLSALLAMRARAFCLYMLLRMRSKRLSNWSSDVSSVSPSSERIEELWVVCGLYTEGGATLLAGAW